MRDGGRRPPLALQGAADLGHYYHFHIRMDCPAGSATCETQAPVPGDDGCGKELTDWYALLTKPAPPPPPAAP